MSSPNRTKILGFFVAMCFPSPVTLGFATDGTSSRQRSGKHSTRLGRRLTSGDDAPAGSSTRRGSPSIVRRSAAPATGARSLGHATAIQVGHDRLGGLLGGGGRRVDPQLGILRRLVGRI